MCIKYWMSDACQCTGKNVFRRIKKPVNKKMGIYFLEK